MSEFADNLREGISGVNKIYNKIIFKTGLHKVTSLNFSSGIEKLFEKLDPVVISGREKLEDFILRNNDWTNTSIYKGGDQFVPFWESRFIGCVIVSKREGYPEPIQITYISEERDSRYKLPYLITGVIRSGKWLFKLDRFYLEPKITRAKFLAENKFSTMIRFLRGGKAVTVGGSEVTQEVWMKGTGMKEKKDDGQSRDLNSPIGQITPQPIPV